MGVLPRIFTSILNPIDRWAFKLLVAKHRSDAYGKSFKSWEHLVALRFAQMTGALSLRAIEVGFNAQVNLHGRLCCSFGWWLNIHQAGLILVTRPKANARWKTLHNRDITETSGDGFTLIAKSASPAEAITACPWLYG
jgi:hypothetical protein